ncbi:MAG: hypothetical protein ACXWCQ_34155, partial [Burkholderiales bacterium]
MPCPQKGGAGERSLLDWDSYRGGGQSVEWSFDNLDHDLVLKAVRRHTNCRWVVLYIERWLKADVLMSDGMLMKR